MKRTIQHTVIKPKTINLHGDQYTKKAGKWHILLDTGALPVSEENPFISDLNALWKVGSNLLN